MPVQRLPSDRDRMTPQSGLAMQADDTVLDVSALLVDMQTRLQSATSSLSQIVTNTGGTDAVNLETILLGVQTACVAVQVACESLLGVNTETRDYAAASRTSLDALVSIQDAARTALQAIQNSSAAGAVDLAAIEVINTAIQTAVEVIDNYVGTAGAAAPAGIAVIGGVAETTVPAAVADGLAVDINWDEYGRHRDAAFNAAQSAGDVTDVAPAQMQVLIETGWVQLDTPGQETPARDVRDYENHTVVYLIDIGGCTDVDLRIWGSIDGTNYFLMWEDNILSTEDLTGGVTFSSVQITYIKCEFEAEAGDTDALVNFYLTSGN